MSDPRYRTPIPTSKEVSEDVIVETITLGTIDQEGTEPQPAEDPSNEYWNSGFFRRLVAKFGRFIRW